MLLVFDEARHEAHLSGVKVTASPSPPPPLAALDVLTGGGCLCRNKYCVKEVSTLTQDICGATQYFGDMYVNKQCVFKKCNATCTPGTYTFSFQGTTYSRTTYCCKHDLCNAAWSSRIRPTSLQVLLLLLALTALVYLS